jgi:hypothetical protein
LQKTPPLSQTGQASKYTHDIVHIRIVDRAGQPIQGAELVLLYSPIRFYAYAGEDLRRSYPQLQVPYDFRISSAFGATLASYLGIEGAPRGLLTEQNGKQSMELNLAVGESDSASGSVHILVNKEGYIPQARTIAASSLASEGEALTLSIVLERERAVSPTHKLNPWTIAQELERQVNYFIKKYDADPSWKSVRLDAPPLTWERFEEYTLAAIAFAPDYPVVQSAMFFYEIEKGQLLEARKFSRFIDDSIYLRVIYDMTLTKGLPMR